MVGSRHGSVLLGVLAWLALLGAPSLEAQDFRSALGEGDYVEDLRTAFDDLRAGRRERARLRFEEVLLGEEEDEPASSREQALANAGLARIAREEGKYEAALELIAKAWAQAEVPELKLYEARVLALLGRYAKALELAGKLLRAQEDPSASLVLEAKVRSAGWLMATGKAEAARQRLLEVEDSGKRQVLKEPRARYWYAESLRLLGGRERYYQASALFIEVTKEDPALAEAYVSRGDLLYLVYREARGFPSGESEYKRALENCGEVEGALVGLFESRRENFILDYAKTQSFLARALELNPRSVPALRAKARQLINDRSFEAAYPLLERALAINPNDKETLAELAAVSHLTYRKTEEEEYRKRVAELQGEGKGGLADSVLGRHLVALYRFQDSLTFLMRAVEANDSHPASLLGLGKALIYAGRTEEGAEVLEKSKELLPGFVNPWRENQLFLQKRVRDSYEEFDLGNFVFVLHPSAKGVLLPYLKETYEDAWRQLGAKYGTFPDCKVRVEDFERFGDFSVRTIGYKGFGALGACFGCFITSVSPAAPELRSQFSWKVTAWHEFSHVLHLKLSKARVPRWLTEGMAVFEELSLDPSYDRRMERELYSAWINEELLPLSRLNTTFRSSKILFGYYQGGLIVRHLARDYGFQKVLDLLIAYGEDKSTEQIFKEVFGLTTKEYDRKFRAYVKELIGAYRIVPVFGDEAMNRLRMRVVNRPEDIAARLQLADAYAQRGQYVDAGGQLAWVRKKDPDNGEAYLVRARIAERRGDTKEARRLLQLGFENGASDFESHMIYASILEKVGRKREALEHYDRAIVCWTTCSTPGAGSPYLGKVRLLLDQGETEKAMGVLEEYVGLNGRDYGAHIQLAKYYRERDAGDRELLHMERARDIDPFDRGLHERLAEIYRKRGRLGEAKRALDICLAILPERDRKQRSGQPGQGDGAEEEWLFRARVRLSRAELMRDMGEREASKREASAVLEEGDRLPSELRKRAKALLD
ncbi:MAG: tetratricopeptide repeat protein [Planctomycetota bacterium]